MEFFDNLSTFLTLLSQRTRIKIHFRVENVEENVLNDDEKSILKALNKVLESALVQRSNSDPSEESKSKTNGVEKCQVCCKKFAHFQLLKFHTQSFHEKSGQNVPPEPESNVEFQACLSCSQCFKSWTQFESHMCDDFKLRIPQNLVQFQHQFSCGICSSKFKNLGRIQAHVQHCQNQTYTCPHCQLSQGSLMDLCQHLALIHKISKPYQCQLCSSSFKFKSSLSKHLFKSHNESNDLNNFQCDSCPKRFIKKVYLTNHKLKFHGLKKGLLCPKCGHQFLTYGALKKHQKQAHCQQLSSQFQCHVCPKTFQRKDKLNNHLSIHSGNKPFQCNLCPKTFITKCKLNDHQKRHFGDQKRFTCLLCPNKAYAGSHDLRKHLDKIHPKVAEKMLPKVPILPQFIDYMTSQSSK